jgi:hypothetical protein
MAKGTKEKCPACGKSYGVPYLYQHMRTQHGIYGGASGKTRGQGEEEAPELPVERTNGHRPSFKGQGFRVMEDFIVLADDHDGVWLAERIR